MINQEELERGDNKGLTPIKLIPKESTMNNQEEVIIERGSKLIKLVPKERRMIS